MRWEDSGRFFAEESDCIRCFKRVTLVAVLRTDWDAEAWRLVIDDWNHQAGDDSGDRRGREK